VAGLDSELIVDGLIDIERFLSACHLLISPRGRAGGFVDDALAQLGLERRVVVTSSSFTAAALIAAQADALVTMPARVAGALMRSGLRIKVAAPPLELPTINLSMVYHERFKRDAAHRWLRESIMRVVASAAGDRR
jgi:DNA-binding transcriptional LysR family regulator